MKRQPFINNNIVPNALDNNLNPMSAIGNNFIN